MSNLFEIINDAREKCPVDVDKLAAQIGLPVSYVQMSEDISGELVRVDGRYKININANHPRTRQRFTLAHELGHYVYHRSLIGDGVNDNKAYRTTTTAKNFNPRVKAEHETEANRFAASLLMPMAMIDHLYRVEGMTVEEVAERMQVSKHAASIRLGVPYDNA
jgi:Zn-dependent peptidase ImmA (M78 family)